MTIARISQLASLPSLLCFCMCITPVPRSAQARSFTIDQVLGAPFPTDLTAAPSHGRIAWVFNPRGSRNIWLAEPSANGSYKTRPLTSYKGDDGEYLAEFLGATDDFLGRHLIRGQEQK